MKQRIFFILSLTILLSCSQTQYCPDCNTRPMFGHAKKCDKQLEADSIFLEECKTSYKTHEEALRHHIDWAWSYFYKDQYDSSIMRFNQAWLLDSTNADIYWGFGSVLGKQQRFKESLIYLNKSNQLNPSNPKVLVCSATSYGQLFFQTKDQDLLHKAIEDLKKSISLDTTYALAYGQLTSCYSYFMQKDSGLKYLHITDRLDPNAVNPEVRKILTEKLTEK